MYAQLKAHVTKSITAVNDVIARIEPRNAPRSGENIHLRVKQDSILLFDSETGTRITTQTTPTPQAANAA